MFWIILILIFIFAILTNPGFLTFLLCILLFFAFIVFNIFVFSKSIFKGVGLLIFGIIIILTLIYPNVFTITTTCLYLICIICYLIRAYINSDSGNDSTQNTNSTELTDEQKKIKHDQEWAEWNINHDANSITKNSFTYQPPKLKVTTIIEVKGVEDDEKDKIKLGYELKNILLYGLRHKIAIPESSWDNSHIVEKLTKSQYPFIWDKDIKVEVRGNILIVDYRLPSIEDIPDFLEIEYKRNQPTVVVPSEKRIKEIWADMSFKIVIRCLHELFDSRQIEEINLISFNGIIKSLDWSTGHVSEKCIMSVMAKRRSFKSLDLTRVDAKQCFKKLKGISAHDLASLTPIPPLMQLNKEDPRFSESQSILSQMSSGENIAAMDWRDFENLIRDLFEKEFSANGSEVKITRASKDGGVDAVVFDPDPIKGGKIIIQAKRYTNTVGVSAVRDLYGTVLNEGASKGILVTTSDYGSDSYNFAKDKPLTLLNGSNLLHLLSKHDYEAQIDLEDAKKILKIHNDE